MRILLILTIVLIQSFNLYADARLAFRNKVELQYENEKKIGYVYHYTYSDGYKKEKESFYGYFKRDFNNKPYLYKEIHSLNLSENFEFENLIIERKEQLRDAIEYSGELQILYKSMNEIIKMTNQMY